MSKTLYNIAIGKSARTKKWINKKLPWNEFADRLAATTKTPETYEEYIKASKDEQAAIKDVGGYVAGYLEGGRRTSEAIESRQIITLDIDFGTPDFWDTFTLLFDLTAVLHGTHKHRADTPRYRLILPLSEKVSPEQYEAVARRVASILGIELFDPTTFQPNRLMYWPSTPIDTDYYFERQDGELLNPTEILAGYDDWTDVSSWPTHQGETKARASSVKKQQNPLEKNGIIGAFCRTYTIAEVIEKYLPDVYEATEDPNRYTFTGGETSGGLVVYDGLFSYSHHQSDPTQGLTCNAFDLVRLHKFGEKGVKEMVSLAGEDNLVRRAIFEEKNEELREDFADDLDEVDLKWIEELEIGPQGNYTPCTNNINLIFRNDPRIKEAFKTNDFDQKNYVFKAVPWRKDIITSPELLKDVDLSGIQDFFDTNYGIVSRSKIEDSLTLERERGSFHPVRDYLKGLEWDGIERVETLLIDYFGADDNYYTRQASRKWITAGVARIFVPGIKFDNVLTLQGEEGVGKSTFGSKLGGEWFSDSLHTVKGKEAFESISGAWIIEIPELAGFKRAEVEEIKHFLSKREDSYRPAYGRVVHTYKRQCIFLGSTNDKDFLISTSGNRRFFPVQINSAKTTKSVFDMTKEDVGQIWAEAVQMYKNGEKLYLDNEAEELARAEQLNHTQTDQRSGMVEEFLDKKIPENWENKDLEARRLFLDFKQEDDPEAKLVERQTICAAAIWSECFGKDPADMAQFKTREINFILRSLEGWGCDARKTKRFKLYGTQKYFQRKQK